MEMGMFSRRMANCLLRLDAGIGGEEQYVSLWDKWLCSNCESFLLCVSARREGLVALCPVPPFPKTGSCIE